MKKLTGLLTTILLLLQATVIAQITDNDGRIYKTVTINSKTWMAENLSVSKFNSGAAIPQAKTKEQWEAAFKAGKPMWCYVNFDPGTEKTYGKLYNYFAVADARKLAPAGWHVSTDEEWTSMINYLGNDDAERKLKNTEGWKTDDFGENGNNESGFSALPAGFITYLGIFGATDRFAHFWTTPVIKDTNKGWSRRLDLGNFVQIARNYDSSAGNGLSVRCVKD